MPEKRLLLGIDIGTQAVKGVLTSLEGQIACQASIERGPNNPRPGWVEMDPEQDLWGPVIHVIKKLFEASDVSPEFVKVLGISGLVPCLCTLDEDSRPVGATILYSDNRAIEELEWINQTIGLHLTAEAPIPKLIWIRNHEPQRFDRIRTVFSAHNYVVFRLTGEKYIDYDTCGIMGGIFDNRNKIWREDICQKLGFPSHLFPPPRPANDIVGGITALAAQQTGLLQGTPVIAGCGDTFPTLLGCGVVDPGDAMVSFGTTGLLTLTQTPLVDSAKGPHFDDGSGNASVSWVSYVLSTGQLIRWYVEQLGQAEKSVSNRLDGSVHNLLDIEAALVPAGSEGLIVLPHWLGRRKPAADAMVRGAMIGFTPSHTPAHIYRAILESFAYNMRQTFIAEKSRIRRVVATAGGARSKLWRQIVTDILNIPMEYYPGSSGALGIAFLAGYAGGLISDFGDIKHVWLRDPIITLPGPSVAMYDRYFEVYCEFEENMVTPFQHLAQAALKSNENS